MKDVAGAYGQVHNFARSHEHAFESSLMSGFLYGLNSCDDEWRCDFVELSKSEGLDDVAFKTSFLVFVADDAASLEVAPQFECVGQDVPARWFLAELLALSAGYLPSLHKAHFWPVT